MTTHGDGPVDPAQQPPAGGFPQFPGPGFGPGPQYGPPPQFGQPQQFGTPGYGQPQPYGQMPPSYPTAPYGGYPQHPVPVGTNGLAIGSLIASSLGFFYGFPALVGIVLGVLALGQIKRTGQQGRGLAIAGIVVGGVFVTLFLVFLIFVLVAVANGY
ncbi:DUF4190 domain-containing protein [Prescottella sp. R16]|uniref:DUF4190 domain-containing protein n=1 Tax=Prescottella sp. R16 TaxID=3064529 RepID=UPI00272EDF65|nr:DUF4190 domain-containing protein [Prescottella sp. R16]